MAKDKNKEQPAHDDDEIRSDNSEFEVESIVGHKIDPEDEERVRYLYRIRWVDYTEDDDTWEPKDSLEGGAEGILADYVETRKNEGDVFFKEGYKRSKIQSYLDRHGIPYEKLEYDAHPPEQKKKKSSKKSSTNRKENGGNDSIRMDESSTSRGNTSTSATAFIEGEKEKKRKQRESLAAENEEQNNKKARRTSDSPLPPPLSKTSSSKHDRAEKENESQSKKPSSKRSTYEEDTSSQQHKKARSSVAQQQQDSDDEAAAAREMEQMKRSPLKEKKADQRKSEEPSALRSKPVSTDKSAHVSTSTPQKVVEEPQEQEEEELPLGSEVNESLPSWEGLVIVESLEQDISTPNKEGYKWFIKWIGNTEYQDEWVSNNLARAKFPQSLLDFYEDHLKFKSNVDEDLDDLPFGDNEGNAVNGDAAMD